ncbi:MAG: TetR/AcrR family transcriptional regulator [Pseudomonadota bacterium]
MARPKSEDKRNAIMEAATQALVAHGLGAPTALIAQEAGVSNGALFTYFETKSDLFNQLYLELKRGMADAVLAQLPARAGVRQQLEHMWSNWLGWAVAHPARRRALAQLNVSDQIAPASRVLANQTMGALVALMEQARADGPLRAAPLGFVVAIINALADATIDIMLQDPGNAERHCATGFEALWRVLK